MIGYNKIDNLRTHGELLLRLNLQRFAEYRAVSMRIDSFDVRSMVEYATEDLVFSLCGSIYSAGNATRVIRFEVAANWLEAWKLEVLTRYRRFRLVKWALKRWPVRYRELSETVEAYALLPDIPKKLGEHTVMFRCFDRKRLGT